MFRNFWESTEVADFTIFFLRFTAMEPIHRRGTQIGWSALAHPTWMAELYNWTPVGTLFRTMVSVRQPRQDWSGANDRIWWDMIGYSYRDRRFFFFNGVEAHWYFPHIFHLGLLLDGGGSSWYPWTGKTHTLRRIWGTSGWGCPAGVEIHTKNELRHFFHGNSTVLGVCCWCCSSYPGCILKRNRCGGPLCSCQSCQCGAWICHTFPGNMTWPMPLLRNI